MVTKTINPAVIATATALLQSPAARMRLPFVLSEMGMSRAHWYDGIARGIYPAGTKIGKRAVAWSSNQIRQILARDAAGVQA
jgi:predicted DNA-binding transcriptional regulator AlpA